MIKGYIFKGPALPEPQRMQIPGGNYKTLSFFFFFFSSSFFCACGCAEGALGPRRIVDTRPSKGGGWRSIFLFRRNCNKKSHKYNPPLNPRDPPKNSPAFFRNNNNPPPLPPPPSYDHFGEGEKNRPYDSPPHHVPPELRRRRGRPVPRRTEKATAKEQRANPGKNGDIYNTKSFNFRVAARISPS